MAELTSSATGSAADAGGQLRRAGVALLPLALFIVAAVGGDWVSAALRQAADRTVAPHQAGPATTTVSAATPEANFQDTRNLLELIARPADGVASASREPEVLLRTVEFVLSGREVVPLGFRGDPQQTPGTYGILRGVPQSARLTHGIAVGSESWMIDGPDIPRAAIVLRAGLPDNVKLEFAVLAADGRALAREKLDLVITAVAVPQTAASDSSSATQAGAEPLTVLATPALPTFSIAITEGTALVPGRGGLLGLVIEPANATPRGAYLVLRGFPAGTALSNGIQVGVESWLLSEADLAGLDVRLPARTTAVVVLDARLLAADGKLLAERRLPIAGVRVPDAVITAAAVPAPAVPVAAPPSATIPAAAEPTRSAPLVSAAQEVTTASIPAAAAAAASKQPSTALARGRRMLEIGNIAIARPLLERAAVEGFGEAAALLAASFDPVWLKRYGVIGVVPDSDKAKHWYDEARRLGATDTDGIVALPGRR